MPLHNTSDQAREALLLELTRAHKITDSIANSAINNFEERIGINFKKKIILIVSSIFAISVIILWAGLWWVASNEYSLLAEKILPPSERVITEDLLLALIAGTVAQVSISFGLMMKFLFSKEEKPKHFN